MKRWIVSISVFLVIATVAVSLFGQKVRLRAKITPVCGGASQSKFADIYADGNIAVQGGYSCPGAFIYDISDADAPVLASWYNPGSNLQFLEAIVIGNRGYFGTGNGGGVHIVDLSDPYNPFLLGTVDAAHGSAFIGIHEMVVFDQNSRRYLIENYNGFATKIIKIIDVTDPGNPFLVRDLNPTEPIWVHGLHVRGNRLFTSGWGNSTNRGRTEIYGIANLATQPPVLLGVVEDTSGITAGNSMHSSWSSEDGNFLYSARETINGTGDVRVYNITNPALPILVNSISTQSLGLNAVTPHNPVVAGNYLYVSWYQAGIQVFDISDKANPVRVGQYDMFPNAFAPTPDEKKALLEADPWDMVCGSAFVQNMLPTTYDGTWAVFPMLGRDKVLA
ncbi:MAG: hypothetical protein ABI539_06285, partial [Acidobacteriota bacterium]